LVTLIVSEPPVLAAFEPDGTALFRAMKKNGDGFPLVGPSSRTLGVRSDGPCCDLPIAADGSVSPETGGMSVALDKAENLPKHRLPKSQGGNGRDAVFRLFSTTLAPTLAVRSDRYPHALVEPSARCLLSQYESDLAATRQHWSKIYE
jgi:hypothetical protein